MIAKDLIRLHILRSIEANDGDGPLPSFNADDVAATWSAYMDSDYECALIDAESEFRHGGERIDMSIPGVGYSRHYELDTHAAKLSCGTWVAWPYWHGGGKHGEPEAIEWMEYAVIVDVAEEQKVVTVRTFKVKP